MGLKLSDWVVLLCFCAFGIQESQQFVAEMREINQNCVRGGGFCINVIPPPPPRRRMNRRQRNRMRTNTRRGQRKRPSPQQVGASHTRLPASVQNTARYPPQQPFQQPAPAVDTFTPMGHQGGGGGLFQYSGAGQSLNPMDSFASMFMFKRKKRQAAVDPEVAAEMPRLRRNQNMYSFLNVHCRKSEFDFGCRSTGGICCMPHP